ncbi:hypothetical protein J4211_03865 [Candidatus Woesearchaeota archaeon]|nr:hypothetical protein [Candidatus Woesearchaeota archaeon]
MAFEPLKYNWKEGLDYAVKDRSGLIITPLGKINAKLFVECLTGAYRQDLDCYLVWYIDKVIANERLCTGHTSPL